MMKFLSTFMYFFDNNIRLTFFRWNLQTKEFFSTRAFAFTIYRKRASINRSWVLTSLGY